MILLIISSEKHKYAVLEDSVALECLEFVSVASGIDVDIHCWPHCTCSPFNVSVPPPCVRLITLTTLRLFQYKTTLIKSGHGQG